jgi:acylphosphatase
MGDSKKIARFIIHGRVQGVFFRDSTRQVAKNLNIKGLAVNQSDGTVVVIADGTQDSLRKLKSWLIVGPDMAKVERVEEVDIECHQEFNDFTIG